MRLFWSASNPACATASCSARHFVQNSSVHFSPSVDCLQYVKGGYNVSRIQSKYSVRLFYSYCHKDNVHRKDMETALALLKSNNLLDSWSDHNILPGGKIPDKVRKAMNDADIIVFLFSQRFIASHECMKEWNYAKTLSKSGTLPYRIPIVLSNCAWLDVLGDDLLKALPNDGTPVSDFPNSDDAWQQVYQRIKEVVEILRRTFEPKTEFIKEISMTEFITNEIVDLRSIFVFPTLVARSTEAIQHLDHNQRIVSKEQICNMSTVFIHGEEVSGKTALARYLFFSFLSETTENSAPIYIDLDTTTGTNPELMLARAYNDEYTGDFSLWQSTKKKILILENMSPRTRCINFLMHARQYFEKIYVTLSTDIYNAFFLDDTRFAEFGGIKIEPLNHSQQERLIRNMLSASKGTQEVTDGLVDQFEDKVNSIIVSNKIVPRFPFYVLSILQTQENFMPDVSITSYGHCYYVLIVAHLVKSGVSSRDMDLNAYFNFLEHLAFNHFLVQQNNSQSGDEVFEFPAFLRKYSDRFFVPRSVVNRLSNRDYGIISTEGKFRFRYMYYYFLGRYLANNKKSTQAIVDELCECSYMRDNQIIILFLVHHTNDDDVIEDILVRQICTLGNISPAKLTAVETARFAEIVASMPENIQSEKPVEDVRKEERQVRDRNDRELEDEELDTNDSLSEQQVGIYRIFKSNEILGQILRNKFGILPKDRIEEIIETISDGGLRLVNALLENENKITDYANFIHTRFPELDLQRVKLVLEWASLLWTVTNIEQIVHAINIPEIRKGVDSVVQRRSTPAYDLVGYFNLLDGAEELKPHIVNRLSRLLSRNQDPFIRRIASIRTQYYMNSHRSRVPVEQAMCSALDITYIPRKRRM